MGKRWKPSALQSDLLERMFTSGPILDREITKQQRAALQTLSGLGLVDGGDDEPWQLSAEGNYYMSADEDDAGHD